MGIIEAFFIENRDIFILILRIIAGSFMVYYGWPKVKNLRSNAGDFVKMGFKPGWLWGTIVALVEFVGGILIILGVWIPLVAFLFGFEMLVGTIWKIFKAGKPFKDWSYDLLFFSLMLSLILLGSGSISF